MLQVTDWMQSAAGRAHRLASLRYLAPSSLRTVPGRRRSSRLLQTPWSRKALFSMKQTVSVASDERTG
ncbi:hypothetical protein ATANTOWER_006088 [Ataeniobius toweri]|uniref:Uncharacterized protein n=1 Tax=Ataeniobius toweri TaxID=208326 RepID=A0ABU7ADX5_9TELE|nr:hypothetical protein [Ataeniobius toweri]